jgi:hypothetical protein
MWNDRFAYLDSKPVDAAQGRGEPKGEAQRQWESGERSTATWDYSRHLPDCTCAFCAATKPLVSRAELAEARVRELEAERDALRTQVQAGPVAMVPESLALEAVREMYKWQPTANRENCFANLLTGIKAAATQPTPGEWVRTETAKKAVAAELVKQKWEPDSTLQDVLEEAIDVASMKGAGR